MPRQHITQILTKSERRFHYFKTVKSIRGDGKPDRRRREGALESKINNITGQRLALPCIRGILKLITGQIWRSAAIRVKVAK
jgi:hypothetical protein